MKLLKPFLTAAAIAVIILAAIFVKNARAAGASGPTYTQQYAYVNPFQSAPGNSGSSATPTTGITQFYFYGHFVNDADPTDTHDIMLSGMPVQFDMLAAPYATKTVTVGGVTLTYAQVYGFMIATGTQEFNASQAAAKAAKTTAAKPK